MSEAGRDSDPSLRGRAAPEAIPCTGLAIATGTSSGIGAALVHELLGRGWEVVGIARRGGPITDPRYHHLRFDLSDVSLLASGLPGLLDPHLRGARWERVGLVNNAAAADLLGPLETLDPSRLLGVYALNTVAPIWLMGYVARRTTSEMPLRVVNVSSGAAVRAFPGLSAYGTSKAALRMAGMELAAELDSPKRPGGRKRDFGVLSYEPGIVETPMQVHARTTTEAQFPWVDTFHGFQRDGLLVPPEDVVPEIASFLESRRAEPFTERRFGS
jgi:NAD(P)-dependent dehydrogenase (short-subunit alcohol dehydrogenase family)